MRTILKCDVLSVFSTLFSFFVRLDYNFFAEFTSFTNHLSLSLSHSQDFSFNLLQFVPDYTVVLIISGERKYLIYFGRDAHTNTCEFAIWLKFMNLVRSTSQRNRTHIFFPDFWSFHMSATWHIVWCVDKMVFLSEMRNLLPKQSFFWLPETGGRRGKWRKMDESNSTLCWNERKREERNKMKFLELNVDRLFDTRGSLKCQQKKIE